MASPQDVASAADVATCLSALREAQGKSIRAVSRETGIPSATLGGYFSGRHLPSTTQPELLDRLLDALGVASGEWPAWHEAIRRVRRPPGPRVTRDNPYRGLEPYGIDDADLFFGRDVLAATIRASVVDAGASDRRWVTLVGASGSGKSSLLRAGVLAGLRAAGRVVAVVTPSEAGLEGLGSLVERIGDGVLGVDQFEELFAPGVDAAHRRAVLALLTGAATRPGGPTIVVAVRADHVDRCADEPLLLPLLRQRHLVGPIDEAALADVIVGPARARGREAESELWLLIRRLAVPERATGPVLPLVSHVLRVMWDRTTGPLTAADYMAVGGVAGAVSATAEELWRGLDTDGRSAARRVFRRLASIDEAGRVTRRRVPREALAGSGEADVVEAFIGQRILVATATDVEVSHEIVFSTWPRLRGWLAEDREALRVAHRLGAAAASWSEHGRPRAELMRGGVLDLVVRIADPDHPAAVALTEPEQEYLAASLADRAHRRRRRRLVRGSLIVLGAGVAALAVATTVLAVHLRRSTESAGSERVRADQALSRQVAQEARDLETSDARLSRRLAVAAYRINPTAQARATLLESDSLPVTADLDPDAVVASLCATVGALTPGEWARYVPDTAYADPCAAR